MMKPTLTLALSVGLAASAGMALAQTAQDNAPQTNPPAVHPADLDGDGQVTADEFETFHKNMFAGADANKDGRLDPDELLSLPKPPRNRDGRGSWVADDGRRSARHGGRDRARRNPEELFATLDANTDGKLGRDELPEGMARHFDRLDADTDGSVTLEELEAAKPDRDAMRMRFEERFKSMDENGDGKVQKSEATGRMIEKFDAMDANSDGAIDETEIEALRSKFHRHGKDGVEDRPRWRQRSDDDGSEPATS